LNDGTGTVNYTYDQANRMTVLTDSDGSQTIYSYDNANRKTMIQYPNGTGMKLTYDGAGHVLTDVGGTMDSSGNIETTYDSYTYSYMNGTSPTQLVQTVTFLDPFDNTSYTRNYSYDSQNRVTDVDVYYTGQQQEIQGWEYGYDAAGNRTSYSQITPSVTASYSYNSGNELTSQTNNGNTINYTYDGNGNLTGVSAGGPSLSYNAKNQTKSIGSNTYAYSGPDQTDRTQINSTTLDYSGLGVSRQEDSSGTTRFVRCSCGMLNNEQLPTGKHFYYLFDGLGSVVVLTGTGGDKENAYDYDPYGNMFNQTEGVSNPYKYAGGYLDASGYYLFGTRYYDPSTGRWTQQDPVGGSLADLNAANRYTYADDNPVSMTDPSGKQGTVNITLSFNCVFGILAGIGSEVGIAAGAAPLILALGALGPLGIVAAVFVSVTVVAAMAYAFETIVQALCQ
jgi:RHS repeat-associated protein